jgi:hypothetical protein
MAPEHVFVGAMPAWVLGEPRPYARAAAEVYLRRALLPGNPLAFVEPPDGALAAAWPFLLGATLPAAPAGALVLRAPAPTEFRAVAGATRAAAAVAAELAEAAGLGRLPEFALEHARATVAVAAETLDQVASHGWTAVVAPGMAPDLDRTGWIGRGPGSVTPRGADVDPLGDALVDRLSTER